MSVSEKMLKVMKIIKKMDGFRITTHLESKFKNCKVGYYYSDDEYFELKHAGYEINIRGDISLKTGDGIDGMMDLDLEKWIDNLLEICACKECTIDGRIYVMIPKEEL